MLRVLFFFSSRRRHTRLQGDWSSDVCSSDLAADESGEVVGIVSQSGSGETQIVPVETMRTARERVLKLRASAPQPWLGFRGFETFKSPLETWVGLGWKPENALPHIQRRPGGVLTAVAT